MKFCMKLMAMISHDNYYSQFCHPSCELVQWTPSSARVILPYSKYNRVNEFVDRRQ
jgi:hypothetical protein